MNNKDKLFRSGFTLIELLVVIAIIGLLSSIVLVSLNDARKKARDTRRITDMKQIQLALELYFDTNGSYPQATNWPDDCDPVIHGSPSWIDIISLLVNQGYLPSTPREPLYPGNSDPYCYFYMSNYTPAVQNDCGIPSGKAALYVIIFSTEATTNLRLPTHFNKLGAAERYCLTAF